MSTQTSQWVEQTLAGLTLEQKIGQLLHPALWPTSSEKDWEQALGGVEPGGVFLFSGGKMEDFQKITRWLQARHPVPIVVSSDLESGAGGVIADATHFPNLMALAAADDESLAFEVGRAAAVEGRAAGIHWSFGPVVDINANPHNPITNTRGLGDDPDRIARLSTAMIRGMQEYGLCATAKHFPGAGFDDRDSHLCTTINPLRLDEWFALSGRMFQEAIDAGVWSIMVGHVSLPACDPGDGRHIQNAPPAVLSHSLVTGLLRERMGFQGVLITDAMEMAGVTSRGTFDEIIPAVIEAGNDMILFSVVERDFPILQRAVEEGRLTEERINESVRRILALKERLGLHLEAGPRPLSSEDREHFRQVSWEVASRAVTLVKDDLGTLPLRLAKGARVLSYHLRGDPSADVTDFDALLRERGVEVTCYDESRVGLLPTPEELAGFDVILISAVIGPSWGTNSIRPGGSYMRDVWKLVTMHHPRLVFVSYGSPYLLYDIPHLPLVINAYSPDANTQRAVLRLLVGEMEATGQSPVDLERPYRFKSLGGLWK